MKLNKIISFLLIFFAFTNYGMHKKTGNKKINSIKLRIELANSFIHNKEEDIALNSLLNLEKEIQNDLNYIKKKDPEVPLNLYAKISALYFNKEDYYTSKTYIEKALVIDSRNIELKIKLIQTLCYIIIKFPQNLEENIALRAIEISDQIFSSKTNFLNQDKRLGLVKKTKFLAACALIENWISLEPKAQNKEKFEKSIELINFLQSNTENLITLKKDIDLWFIQSKKALIIIQINLAEEKYKSNNQNQALILYNNGNKELGELLESLKSLVANCKAQKVILNNIIIASSNDPIKKEEYKIKLQELNNKIENLKSFLIEIQNLQNLIIEKKAITLGSINSFETLNEAISLFKFLGQEKPSLEKEVNQNIELCKIKKAKLTFDQNISQKYKEEQNELLKIIKNTNSENRKFALKFFAWFLITKDTNEVNVNIAIKFLEEINLNNLKKEDIQEIKEILSNGYYYLGLVNLYKFRLNKNLEFLKNIDNCIGKINLYSAENNYMAIFLKSLSTLFENEKNIFHATQSLELIYQEANQEMKLSIEPFLAIAYNICGEFYFKENNFDTALNFFKKAYNFKNINACINIFKLNLNTENIDNIDFLINLIDFISNNYNQNSSLNLNYNNEYQKNLIILLNLISKEEPQNINLEELKKLKLELLFKKAIAITNENKDINDLLWAKEQLEFLNTNNIKDTKEYLIKVYNNLIKFYEKKDTLESIKNSLNIFKKLITLDPQNYYTFQEFRTYIISKFNNFENPKDLVKIVSEFEDFLKRLNDQKLNLFILDIKYLVLDYLVNKYILNKNLKKIDIPRYINNLLNSLLESSNEKYKSLAEFQKVKILEKSGQSNLAFTLLKDIVNQVNNKEVEKLFDRLKQEENINTNNKMEIESIENNDLNGITQTLGKLEIKTQYNKYLEKNYKFFEIGQVIGKAKIEEFLKKSNLEIQSINLQAKDSNDILPTLFNLHKRLNLGDTNAAVNIGKILINYQNYIPDVNLSPNILGLPDWIFICKSNNLEKFENLKSRYPNLEETMIKYQNIFKSMAINILNKYKYDIENFMINSNLISKDIKNIIDKNEKLKELLFEGIAFEYFKYAYNKNKDKEAEFRMDMILYYDEDDYNEYYEPAKMDLDKIDPNDEVYKWMQKQSEDDYYGKKQ